MAYINFIPEGYQQEGQICLVASYSFVIGYYDNLRTGHCQDFNLDCFLNEHLVYIQEAYRNNGNQEQANQIQIDQIQLMRKVGAPSFRMDYENFVSRIIHHYCQVYRGDIRGYQYLVEFDENRRLVNRLNNYRIKDHKAERAPIPDANNIVLQHLTEDANNLALVLYQMSTKFHSVMICMNEEGRALFRDSNSKYVSETASDDFRLNAPSRICEYILFSASN